MTCFREISGQAHPVSVNKSPSNSTTSSRCTQQFLPQLPRRPCQQQDVCLRPDISTYGEHARIIWQAHLCPVPCDSVLPGQGLSGECYLAVHLSLLCFQEIRLRLILHCDSRFVLGTSSQPLWPWPFICAQMRAFLRMEWKHVQSSWATLDLLSNHMRQTHLMF